MMKTIHEDIGVLIIHKLYIYITHIHIYVCNIPILAYLNKLRWTLLNWIELFIQYKGSKSMTFTLNRVSLWRTVQRFCPVFKKNCFVNLITNIRTFTTWLILLYLSWQRIKNSSTVVFVSFESVGLILSGLDYFVV